MCCVAVYALLCFWNLDMRIIHAKCRFIVITHYYKAVRQNFTHKLCLLNHKHNDVTTSTYFCCLHPNLSCMESINLVLFLTRRERAFTIRTARAHSVSTHASLNMHKQIAARARFTQNARPASSCWEPPCRVSIELCQQRHKRVCTRRR